jgi:hypothetical protein
MEERTSSPREFVNLPKNSSININNEAKLRETFGKPIKPPN